MYEENIDKMTKLLEQNHISLPEGTRKTDSGSKTDDHDVRVHRVLPKDRTP